MMKIAIGSDPNAVKDAFGALSLAPAKYILPKITPEAPPIDINMALPASSNNLYTLSTPFSLCNTFFTSSIPSDIPIPWSPSPILLSTSVKYGLLDIILFAI